MKSDLWFSVIAIRSFHAVEKGITVVCSGGNDRPMPGTLANIAPWILTVAATTINRDFVFEFVLGDSRVIKVLGLYFVLCLQIYNEQSVAESHKVQKRHLKFPKTYYCSHYNMLSTFVS